MKIDYGPGLKIKQKKKRNSVDTVRARGKFQLETNSAMKIALDISLKPHKGKFIVSFRAPVDTLSAGLDARGTLSFNYKHGREVKTANYQTLMIAQPDGSHHSDVGWNAFSPFPYRVVSAEFSFNNL